MIKTTKIIFLFFLITRLTSVSAQSYLPITGGNITTSDLTTSTGQGRFGGWYVGGGYTGIATEIGIAGGEGYVLVYDRNTQTYGNLNLNAGSNNIKMFNNGETTFSNGIISNGNIIWAGYKAGNPRALSLGYSGGNYGGIGYNIDYTTTSGIFNKPLNDQSSYLEFTQGGFKFFGTNNSVSASGINLNGGGNNLNLFATITNTGDFGIGTNTPKEKLSVNGKIRAHEVKVETANWPDYVFEEGYDVGTLEKLESYIKTNKHLPEVPSAKEIEANGVELGEMNKILLKKIEELTLHLIEKNKEVQSLKADVNAIYKLLQKDTAKPKTNTYE